MCIPPADHDLAKPRPAVAVAHPNSGVKAQAAGLYAQRQAEQGYITIIVDAAYQGASEGQSRIVDKPANRIEDIHGVADFITRHAEVDVKRLGLLSICGGGYSLVAAETDNRFRSVATLSMFNSGRVRRNPYNDSQLDSIQQRLRARAKETASDEVPIQGSRCPCGSCLPRLPAHCCWCTPALSGRLHRRCPGRFVASSCRRSTASGRAG